MTFSRYEIADIPSACQTLMGPARRIMEEHRRNSLAREEQSLAPARVAESLEKTGSPGISPESLREVAYSPTARPRQVLCEESAMLRPNSGAPMNLSSIQTRIIQDAGRYCDRFASDVLVELAMLEPFDRGLADEVPGPGRRNDWLVVMGLREDGCDGQDAVMHQLRESQRGTPYVYPAPYYRKLLGVYVLDEHEGEGYLRRTAVLMDLTHDVYKLADGE